MKIAVQRWARAVKVTTCGRHMPLATRHNLSTTQEELEATFAHLLVSTQAHWATTQH